MRLELIEIEEILDFEKRYDLDLVVRERRLNNLPKFYASFERVHELGNGVISSTFGNGDSVDEAISDYAKELSLKRISPNADSPYRTEIYCPKLIHTRKTNL